MAGRSPDWVSRYRGSSDGRADQYTSMPARIGIRGGRSRVFETLGALALSCVVASAVGAQSRSVQDSLRLPGVTLHYQTRGRGEPVLILSGGPGAPGAYLEPVYDSVAHHARAILLDQRGTGRSVLGRTDSTTLTLRLAVEDIEALRKRLGVEKLTLLGHSWGGQLAMAYTVAHPKRVRALILVGSAGAGPGLGDQMMEKL